MREKGRKVAIHCVFPMIWSSGGSKSRLAKAAGAELAGQMGDEQLHAVVARSTFPSQNAQSTPGPDHFWQLRCPPLWREAHFEVKMRKKTPGVRTTFGGSDVEQVHAVVARSTFQSQNVKKHQGFGPLLEVQMSKKMHAVVARSRFRSQNVQNTRGSDHFWRFRCRFASLHYTTLHYTTLHYNTLHYTTLQYTTLHYTTLQYTPLPWMTLQHTTLHYTTLHYTPLHKITLHYTTLRYNTLHSTTLHYTTLHYTTLHYTEWRCTTDRQVDR